MRPALALLLVCHAVTVAGPAVAAAPEDGLTVAYKACVQRSRGITVELHNCQAAEYERQDLKLNTVYKARMAALPADRRIALRNSERAWLKATEARCDGLGEEAGGSMAPLVVNDCWLEAIVQRTRWIERYR